MRPTTIQRSRGDAAEALVAHRLERLGWTVLARNVRVGRHELDIVALDPGPPRRLVVVEVRWRSSRDFGLPEETFDRQKRAHVLGGLMELIATGRLPDGSALPRAPAAVDLVVVEPPARPGRSPRLRHHRDT